MTSGYMVVAKDGKEHGPLDRDTIQRWYFEGRIDRNSKVWEPGKHHFRLHEMFDLMVWANGPAAPTPASSSASLSFLPKTIEEAMSRENEPTNGMFAAGILLIINGVLGLLAIAVLLLFKLGTPSEPRDFVVPIVDLVVATGLLRGRERFKKWGLVRAVLGGVFVLLSAPMTTSTAAGWAEVFFQLVFCAGIVVLLAADSPSNLRVGIGVAAVLVAWSGVFTTYAIAALVTGMRGEAEQSANSSVPEARFDDFELGVKVKLPPGWALITENNPIPDAALVAAHNQSGCGAALIAEPVFVEFDSLDDYLSTIVEARRKDAPDLKELRRAETYFGGNPGTLVETSWTADGTKLRGFTTACRAGSSYYLLTGWCLDEDSSKAFSQYQSLEAAFEIAGSKPQDTSITVLRSAKPSGKKRTASRK